MRIVGEISHPYYKITLFQWNGKYIVKIESGACEQSYKVSEYDLSEDQLHDLVDEEFLKKVSRRFQEMHDDLEQQIENL